MRYRPSHAVGQTALLAMALIALAAPAHAAKIPIFFGSLPLFMLSLAILGGIWLYSIYQKKILDEKIEQARPYIKKGDDHASAGRFPEAIAEYSQALDLLPKAVPVRMQRARIHAAAGADDQAIADFSTIISANGKDAVALYSRAGIFMKRKQYDQAISDLSRCLKIEKLGLLYSARGQVYAAKGDDKRAIEDFTEAIGFDKLPQTFAAREASYERLGEMDKAARDRSAQATLETQEAATAAPVAPAQPATPQPQTAARAIDPPPVAPRPAAAPPLPTADVSGLLVAGIVAACVGIAVAAYSATVHLQLASFDTGAVQTLATISQPKRISSANGQKQDYTITLSWSDTQGNTQSRSDFSIPASVIEPRLTQRSVTSSINAIYGLSLDDKTPQFLKDNQITIRYAEPAATGRVLIKDTPDFDRPWAVMMSLAGGVLLLGGLMAAWLARKSNKA